jgi:hypothetical protein
MTQLERKINLAHRFSASYATFVKERRNGNRLRKDSYKEDVALKAVTSLQKQMRKEGFSVEMIREMKREIRAAVHYNIT